MEEQERDERIRISFQRVKEDINSFKIALEEQKNEIIDLKKKIDEIYSFISEIKENKDSFKKISNGNKGVINDHQQSSTMNNNEQQSSTIKKDLQASIRELSQSLSSTFQALTDREFSVFVAVFELQKQLPEVTYTDLANKLQISEPTIRNTINRLISKNIPLQKSRFFNKKVSLFIPKDLHNINMISKLIELHQNPHQQKTLFDI